MARVYIIEAATDMTAGATYSGGAAPSTGDTLAWDVTAGVQEMTGAGTAISAVNLNRLEVNQRAAPIVDNLVVAVTNGTAPTVLLRGYGGRLGLAGNATKIAVVGQTDFRGISGTYTTLYVKGSRANPVYITSGADVETLIVDGAHVILETHASGRLDFLYMLGSSRVDTKRSVDKGFCNGAGRLILRDGATVTDGAAGAILKSMGDRFVTQVLAKAAVTLDKVEGYGGMLDCEGSAGDVTLTNCIRAEGFAIRERFSGGKIVYTNTPTDYGTEGGLGSIGGPV